MENAWWIIWDFNNANNKVKINMIAINTMKINQNN